MKADFGGRWWGGGGGGGGRGGVKSVLQFIIKIVTALV